ncbi:MAG: SPOR domain-containing protein [Sphingomonadales bacterium]|nr:SPOR domain-containing protein [Sphingomonadales bacterium]
MRLPVNHDRTRVAAALTAALLAAAPIAARAGGPANGPAADYPVVLGGAYSAGGTVFTPVDTMNFDAVGYASVAAGAGGLVSAAHHTLPVPSYVEVTSLESGRTILVRIDRRGPMESANLIELSAAAAAQLGVGDHAAVRVRRVNPPEQERALLRGGAQAPERLATPRPLLAVLGRKLAPNDTVSLARSAGPGDPGATSAATPPAAAPVAPPGPIKPAAGGFDAQFADIAAAAARPPVRKGPEKPAPRPVPKPASVAPAAVPGGLVVQAGAFAVKANADQAAARLGATAQGVGKLWRVRMGPYANRAQAEAALAKAHAAGYSGARIQHAE